jgi:hypothetical protein
MNDRLITEEDYREALRRFMEFILGETTYGEDELTELIRLLETYEYENC